MASMGGAIIENPVNSMERGTAVVGNYVERVQPETVEVGYRGNDFQIVGGGATVNSSMSNVQKVGYQQAGSGDLTGSFVQKGQMKEVYDNMLGSMVYVLDENQTVDGLEPIVTAKPETTQYYQSRSTIEQAGKVNEAVNGNQQGEDAAYKTQIGASSLSNSNFQPTITADKSAVNLKIEDNGEQVKPMNPQNNIYQSAGSQIMTTVYDQSGNMKLEGKNVYDPRVGQMVFVPNAQVDEQKTIEVNTTKAPEEPLQGMN